MHHLREVGRGSDPNVHLGSGLRNLEAFDDAPLRALRGASR
jgi:hypothetical protein